MRPTHPTTPWHRWPISAAATIVRATLGSGFAAAVLPVSAQTQIKTDSAGLVVGEVSDPGGRLQDAGLPRRARRQDRILPVVLVISEIFGVHEHIADVARRFARQGYLAIAPELFVRQGDAGQLRRDRQADRRSRQPRCPTRR